MPKGCIRYCQKYLERNGITCIYGSKYNEFLAPHVTDASSVNGLASVLEDNEKAEHEALAAVFDKLPELAQSWGINTPDRIYMAVGLRSINQFLPGEFLTSNDRGRGGWIKVDEEQRVLNNEKVPADGLFAAGNCTAPDVQYPKNAFPGEDMASVACHNIMVLEGQRNTSFGCCFGFCRPKRMKKMKWGMGVGLCATSLGPHDATLVIGATSKKGSGCTILKGRLAAWNKEFVRWSKVDEIGGGCIGSLVWKFVH
jgi:hypothetical protein